MLNRSVLFLLLTVIVSTAGIIGWMQSNSVQTDDGDTRTFDEARGELRGAKLSLEVMRTREERMRGLSGLPRLEEDQAMLFVFEHSHIPRFWMKDMHFPIDILWLDEDLRVVDTSENLSPDTYRSANDAERFSPSEPVWYALETVAGFAERQNIKNGDRLILPEGLLNEREG